MTTKTRRRVFLAVLVLTLTLPAEVIMLKALQSPDSATAVQQWAQGLSETDLSVSADNIQGYPFAYRRQIMVRLSPIRRSAVWQRHIQQYIKQHPELDGSAVGALQAAQSALTPQLLSDPTPADRDALNAAAEQVQTLLGRETAVNLLMELGPRDGTFASAEPLAMKLATWVRDQVLVTARDGDCECSTGSGCGGSYLRCSNEVYCQWDVVWPMCGWGWSSVCDGVCGFY